MPHEHDLGMRYVNFQHIMFTCMCDVKYGIYPCREIPNICKKTSYCACSRQGWYTMARHNGLKLACAFTNLAQSGVYILYV